MRQFVVVGHEAPSTPEFGLDDLPGAGRVDLLARSLLAGLLLSHDIREDAAVTLLLGDDLAVRFDGAALEGLHPDERSAAALLRAALEDARDVVGLREVETRPGVFVSRRDLERVLADAEGTVVQLHEDGEPAAGTSPPQDPVFVLSDHRDLADAEAETVASAADRRVSLGPRALHADHAIAVANNWVDAEGWRA